MLDIVDRARQALEGETWCWTGPQTPEIVPELVDEVERLRGDLRESEDRRDDAVHAATRQQRLLEEALVLVERLRAELNRKLCDD